MSSMQEKITQPNESAEPKDAAATAVPTKLMSPVKQNKNVAGVFGRPLVPYFKSNEEQQVRVDGATTPEINENLELDDHVIEKQKKLVIPRGATGITVREFKDGYFENKHVSLEQVLASQSSHPDFVPVEIIDKSEIKDDKKKKTNAISLVPIQSMKSPSKSKKIHPSSSTSDLTATNGNSFDISASKSVLSSSPSLSQSMAHSATMPNLQQLSGKVMKKKSMKDANGISSIPLPPKKKSSSPPQERTSFSSTQPVSTLSSQAPQVFIGPKSLQPTSPFLPALITPDFLLNTREPVAARAQSLPTTSHMQQHLMKNNPFVHSMQPPMENGLSSSSDNSDDEFIIKRNKANSKRKSTSPSFSDNSDEEDAAQSRTSDALQFTMDKVNGQLPGATTAAGVLTEEDIMQMALGEKKGIAPSAKFAGGAWTNSPAPQTLPLPKFDKH